MTSDANVSIIGTQTPLQVIQEDQPVRSMPYNTQVESALLGACLRNNTAFEAVAEIIQEEHFYAQEHAKIFSYIAQLIEKGQIASVETLKHIVDHEPMLKEIGGSDYLAGLVVNLVNIISVKDHANIIRDLAIKRALINLGENIVNDAFDITDLNDHSDKQIERAEQELYNLAEKGDSSGKATSLKSAMTEAIEMANHAFSRDNKLVGTTSGFQKIDAILGGFHPSDLLVLAGRPAMGKTALATNFAYNAAAQFKSRQENGREIIEGGRVLFFSLEMSAAQLANRILSQVIGISSDKIRRGAISISDFNQLSTAARNLAKIPLFIDDTPALSVTAVRQRARRVKRVHGLEMIVIDYLQLLQPPTGKRFDGRVQEVSEITRALKTLAKELNVPVIALSQLSRQVEQREDKHPQLSDLRESGSIEQDADVVCFIYRPEYYISKSPPEQRDSETDMHFTERVNRHEKRLEEKRNIAEFIIAKQRHGPVGEVDLHFASELTRFSDLDSKYDAIPDNSQLS